MRSLYARARLLLVPSVWEESSARIIREAQVSGIPAVASDRGGLRDSVGEAGFVLSLAHPIERWCEAVETLFADERTFAACSAAAKERAARPEYGPDHIVARFLEFIAS
jgi:glycosyltransferase involved in cell wall biosynthesis